MLPQLTLAPEAHGNLFLNQLQDESLTPEFQAVTKLIRDMLIGPDGGVNINNHSQNEAARTLRISLQNGSVDKNVFVGVMQSVNPAAVKNFGTALAYDGDDEGQEDASGLDESSGGDPNSLEEEQGSLLLGDGSDMDIDTDIDMPSSISFCPISVDESNNRIKAVNATLATLIEYSDTKTYSSPYGSVPLAAPQAAAPKPSISKEIPAKATVSAKAAVPRPQTTAKTPRMSLDPEKSQVDFLLHLAGGGSMTDDEDDENEEDDDDQTISDLDEAMEDESGIQADYAVKDMADFVANRLVTDKLTGQNNGVLGAQSIDEQVAKVQEVLAQAQLSVNLIMPRTLSRSTYQLYDWVSNRARSYTAPEEPKTTTPTVVVDNLPPRQSVPPPQLAPLTQHARPQSVPPPPHHHMAPHPLPPLPALFAARPGGMSMLPTPHIPQGGYLSFANRPPPPPPPSRSETEHKRIRMYGFPPPPGNRVGNVQRG